MPCALSYLVSEKYSSVMNQTQIAKQIKAIQMRKHKEVVKDLKEEHEAALHDHCSFPTKLEATLRCSLSLYPLLQLPQTHSLGAQPAEATELSARLQIQDQM